MVTGTSPASSIRPADSGGRRLRELDSVRGVASMSVVLLHFRLMWFPRDTSRLPWSNKVLLLALKPFYAGTEAVILFFVLSGLVLSLPYVRGRGQAYPRYLARRILRIYGPYLAALALAIGGAAIWHGYPHHGEWDAAFWSGPIRLRLVLQHIIFLGAYDWNQYDFVVWSLIQEMRVSIIFPFLFALIIRLGTAASISLGIVFSLVAVAVVQSSPYTSARYSYGITPHYIAFFIVGIVIASRLDRVEAWWERTSRRTHWLLAIGSLLAYCFDQIIATHLLRLLPFHNLPTIAWLCLTNWISMCGSIGWIILALHAQPARCVLNSKPARFLGRISYSLYLLHPVVLLALTFACGDRVSKWIQFPVYIAGSLIVSWIFCVVVEESFIRWGRAL